MGARQRGRWTVGGERRQVERLAQLALDCVHREYPTHASFLLRRADDLKPVRTLTPAFYGCFDWHSAVHGHWLLARVARECPELEVSRKAMTALGESFTRENLSAEVAHLRRRPSFERPYGLAWLLQLAAELRGWRAPEARAWQEALAPLEQLAASRFHDWLPKLAHPIRTGEHSQTAFALGLVLDWALVAGDESTRALVRSRALAFHVGDRDLPLHLEPSGHDFLSPSLATVDLLRRVLSASELASWLRTALPRLPEDPGAQWLAPVRVSDPGDGKLAHLDGLNLSRAWMLEGIAASLPPDDARIPALRVAAERHRETGLSAVSRQALYAGTHWLGSFAVYLVTGRGLHR